MKLCRTLKAAIDSVDLSTDDKRCGATALAVLLLDSVLSKEIDEFGGMPVYLCDIGEKGLEDYTDNEYDINALSTAISILYKTYCLNHYRRLGIRHYICKNAEMFDHVEKTKPNVLWYDD